MDLKDRILKTSRDHFFRFGIRNVTMKDISDSLGISKKTLYNHFDTKDSIVTEITEIYLSDHAKRCEEIMSTSSNAIYEIMSIMAYIQKTISQLNASMLNDLKKYHTVGWDAMEKHKKEHIENLVDKNLTRGKAEGLYRLEINNKIFTRLKTVYAEIIHDDKFFSESEFNYAELHGELMTHFLYGICTEKGHIIINQLIKDFKHL